MNRILYSNVLLIICVQTVTSVVKANISVSTRSSRGTYSMFKKFKLSANEIDNLHNLRSDIASLVATYVQPGTTKSTLHVNWISNKIKRRRSRDGSPHSRRTKITTKGVYKNRRTYPTHLERRKMIYWHLVSVFSGNDKEKEKLLTNKEKPPRKGTMCYLEAFSCFTQHCLYDHYWKLSGMSHIQDLLARACQAEWLTTSKIRLTLQSCCKKRFKYRQLMLF